MLFGRCENYFSTTNRSGLSISLLIFDRGLRPPVGLVDISDRVKWNPLATKPASNKRRNNRGGYVKTEALTEGRSSLQKAILLATVVSGFIAAYLMYRRGESLGSIAKQAITNPVGSLVSEVKNSV
jgi:hypothetical protein